MASIILFGGNFAPKGWAFCQGQILSIAQNTALFSLLGTTYGGNGQTTFALPDLRGRTPVGTGQGPGLPSVELGEMGGEPTHTLIITEMPAHNHTAQLINSPTATVAANTKIPGGNYLAPNPTTAIYYSGTTPGGGPLAGGSVTVGIAGGSQPHNNMQPYLGLNYIIALEGVFPSRN